jgi:lipopolysaccharide biosynthesis glycosyltransferase
MHYGYEYLVITRPYFTALGVECCWLKLTLLLEALNAGYDTVLFVDADAYINTTAHELERLLEPDKYLYLAKSYSGRFNSGVILVNNHFKIRQ